MAELGLGHGQTIQAIRPLTGGVSSDIAVVAFEKEQLCVKCAMEQLRVDEPWFAPVRRNRAEYNWISFAGQIAPGAVPRLYGISQQHPGFAMQFIDPASATNYKSNLMAGQADSGAARAVGRIIGQIHAASTQPGFDPGRFSNADDFFALRLDPYLAFTADRHPDVADTLHRLVDDHHQARIALVHGDLSPKNILIGNNGPILLDAECATFGDPAFDPAFFLNHLLIKSFHLPDLRTNLLQATGQFMTSYLATVSWEAPNEIEKRIAAMLPALMLARVDGKSPVEYLDSEGLGIVRQCALALLAQQTTDIATIVTIVAQYQAERT